MIAKPSSNIVKPPRPHSVYVLGAGFSKPGGLPLTDKLFDLIRTEAQSNRFGRLEKDVSRFRDYLGRVDRNHIDETGVGFEQFVSFLDIEHFLFLMGSDHEGEEANSSQSTIRNLAAHVLWEHQRKMSPKQDGLYTKFAELLHRGDIVITFNYDTLVERSLDKLGKPYRFVLEPASDEILTEDVVILKMHGSIDWFDISAFHRNVERAASSGAHYVRLPHPIFDDYSRFQPTRIADTWSANDGLANVYRVQDLDSYFDSYFQNRTHSMCAPLILSPSFSKMLYMNPLRELWYGLDALGTQNARFVIIGFSLPEHDAYVRQPIGTAIANYQNLEGWGPKEREKVTFVDLQDSDGKISVYQDRWSFVDWSRARCWWKGFGHDAMSFLSTP